MHGAGGDGYLCMVRALDWREASRKSSQLRSDSIGRITICVRVVMVSVRGGGGGGVCVCVCVCVLVGLVTDYETYTANVSGYVCVCGL